jgi:hypothetical protein
MRLHTGVGFGNARYAVNLYHTILKSYFLRSGQERTAQGNAVMAPPPITGAPRFPSCHLLHLTRFAVADVRKAASQLFDSRVDTSLPPFTPQQAQELQFLNGAKMVGLQNFVGGASFLRHHRIVFFCFVVPAVQNVYSDIGGILPRACQNMCKHQIRNCVCEPGQGR